MSVFSKYGKSFVTQSQVDVCYLRIHFADSKRHVICHTMRVLHVVTYFYLVAFSFNKQNLIRQRNILEIC